MKIALNFVWHLAACALFLTSSPAETRQSDQQRNGEYLAIAGGCISCHTDFRNKGEFFAGGAPIRTPFGTFVPPNITPSREHGIGKWSNKDFIRAMRQGKNPKGSHYFPAFPYTSYTRLTTPDLKAMKAYLFSLAPVEKSSASHDILFPFNWRFLQAGWKMLFFREGVFQPDPQKSSDVNRGDYLANALAHCGECHTPRNRLGGLDYDRWMAGTPKGPENNAIPNITPDSATGLMWSVEEITEYLKTGTRPDFDFAGSLMADVIEHNTSKWTDADLIAIAVYLKSLRPVRNEF